MFSKKLNEKLDEYHLLKHPFYKSWNEGKLNREIIKDYAEQYYQHVKAFPRYISATHSICEDLDKRRILLENLQDEEKKDADHPMLWKNFALSVGAKADEIEKKESYNFTKELIENFFKNARASYAEGLGSLYTYERQVPEIADTKIRGLKTHYGVNSKKGLELSNGTYIFCLPGSSGACKTGWNKILKSQLDIRNRPCNFAEIIPRLTENLA